MKTPDKTNTEHDALPDIIAKNLDILFVGYNPGLESARTGYHYAGKSNRFWKLLYESAITPYKLDPSDCFKLLALGYGSTNIVNRPTKSASEITSSEFRDGAQALAQLIKKVHPRIVCYVGIGVYKAFVSNILKISIGKLKISVGIQEKSIVEGVTDFVCSNPSGLNVIPYEEQLQCFKTLKSLVDLKEK